MTFFLFLFVIGTVYSHQIETETIENELYAKVSVSCASGDYFGFHASANHKPNYTLSQIEHHAKIFTRVNKNSSNWDFFYFLERDGENYEDKLSFPLKHAANYTFRFFCDELLEEMHLETPFSTAKISILSAKFKNSSNLTNHNINHLVCALNEWGQPLGYSSYTPNNRGCRNEKTLVRIPLKDQTDEVIVSIVPDWARVNFERKINQGEIAQILKKVPQLKSLDLVGEYESWAVVPNLKIEKIKPKSMFLTPSLSVLIQNSDYPGFIHLFIKKASEQMPTKEELMNGSQIIYLRSNQEKRVEMKNLSDLTEYVLYSMVSSLDPSNTGMKSQILKNFEFLATPYYDVKLENSYVSLKAWSHSPFFLYIGIGDENNDHPNINSLMTLRDGQNNIFGFSSQILKDKKGQTYYEALYFYSISRLSQKINLWFMSSSVSNIAHNPLHFMHILPNVKKMELTQPHAFNVDPSEFLGFQGYKIRSNVPGTIYAALIDNPTAHVTRDFIRTAISGAKTHEFKVLKAWKGNVTETDYFEITYQDDEDDDVVTEELKEETRYKLVFFGSSEQALRESDLVTRWFLTPNTALLYSCEDEN